MKWILKNRFVLGVLAALGMVATLAAVNGVFNSVNSINGYQVNGGTGNTATSFALCSFGSTTRFDFACPVDLFGNGTPNSTGAHCDGDNQNQRYVNIATYDLYYCKRGPGPIYLWTGPFGGAAGTVYYQTVTGRPQEPALTFGSGFALSDSAGVATVVNLANGSAVARTCNSNGCYDISSTGTIHEWGVTASFDTGPSSVTLPLTMPAALENVQLTQCFDSSGTGCSGASTTTRQWEAGSFTTSGFSVRNDGSGQAQWNAWGH